MSPHPTTESLDRLLRHSDWLAGLARRLVADAAAAEDLVQDTWAAALRSPPDPARPARPWLAGVARRLSRLRARRESRVAPSLAASDPESRAPAAGEVAARIEQERRLAGMVLGLEEPYRSTLLLRFYRGRSAAWIARDQAVPASTVRARIRRGLDRLRERLEREEAGRGRTWLAALAPFSRDLGIAKGALFVTPKIVAGTVVVAAALLAGAFLWTRASDAPPAVPAPKPLVGSGPVAVERVAAGEAGAGELEASGAGASRAEVRPPGRDAEKREAERAEREAERAASSTSAEVALVGKLVLPDRSSVRVETVSARLTSEDGLVQTFFGTDTDQLELGRLPRGSYGLEVTADGYRHRPETLDITKAGASDDGVITERVTLWPPGWVAVVVRTPDGRPFAALASDLGYEPKRLFVGAFEVGAGHEPFAPGAEPPDGELAEWRPAPGYQVVELPGGVAGSLELRSAPPFWVGLWVHGVLFESRLLQPGDDELAFVIDRDDVDAGLATVTMRLVDRDSGAPVLEARSTLKADTSAHRRKDLSDVAPDERGRVAFVRVMPGQHELAIVRGGHIVQRRIEVGPGEALDLGDLPLGAGPGLSIRVVDAGGAPVHAFVELAPHEPGRHVDDVYPPNLHRATDGDGVYVLPVPDRASIVRIRTIEGGPRFRGPARVGSRNFLVDPEVLPPELVVEVVYPVELALDPASPWIAGTRVTFEDELGMIVQAVTGPDAKELEVELAPGPYLARAWDGEREVGRLDVTVAAGDTAVRCP